VPPDTCGAAGTAGADGKHAVTASESIVVRVADALEAGGVAYVLTGSFARNYYGQRRR